MTRQSTMTKERYRELQTNMDSRLTTQERLDGWIFCNCEWDGLLIHKSDPEADCCCCLQKLFKE